MPKTITVRQFNGGVSDDVREPTSTKFANSGHFDIFSNPYRLTPLRSFEADTNDGSTSTGMKQYFIKDAFYASKSAKLYGLGQTGAGLVKIAYKEDATTGNWTLPSSSEGNGAVKYGCFFEYQDYAWGFQGTNQVFKWGLLSGTPSITNSVTTVASTITSVANGVIAADANAYMAYNNVVVRISTAGTVTDLAKTVPSNFKITSLDNYGKYLAIGCAPISTFNGQSKLFLWDLSSDLFAESVEWGDGELRVIGNVEGMIVGITDRYLNNATGAGKGSLVVQGWNGGTPQLLKEVFTQALTGKEVPQSKAIRGNRLYFAAKVMTNAAGTEYVEGIWSFGRKNAAYPYALALEYVDETVNTSGIQAFSTAANYFFVAHSADGSFDKTNDAATYANTSFYESQTHDFGDATVTHRLDQLSVMCPPIPTGGSITAKYKVDDDTAWTTIGTLSTAGSLGRDFFGIESTGDPFATFSEVRFRLESTGGAEISGIRATATDLAGSTD